MRRYRRITRLQRFACCLSAGVLLQIVARITALRWIRIARR